MQSSLYRIAHLVTHPIQYFAPLYRAVNAQPGVELTVFFYSDMGLKGALDRDFGKVIRWDNDLTGGFNAVFPESGHGQRGRLGLGQWPNWDLIAQLKAGKFDAVWVHGYQHPNALIARLICQIQHIPWVVREDQTLLEPRKWYVSMLKKGLGRLLLGGRHSGALYTGTNSRAHFLAIGASAGRLFPARHHVDDMFFNQQAAALRKHRSELRAEFGVTDDAPVIVFCGKFITKKQPLELIEAFAKTYVKHRCWLLMVGDGELRSLAQQKSKILGLADRVIFPGFLNQGQMPKAYAASDIFVLPSLAHETWGLVVNEAMHSALPIVISDHVGAGADLLHEGVNGYVHQAGDVDSLSTALERLVSSVERREAFGVASAAIIANYTTEQCARDIVSACRALS